MRTKNKPRAIINIQIADKSSYVPSKAQLKKWALLPLSSFENSELTLRIATANESALLNESYRKKKGPTNILSFPINLPAYTNEAHYLGDIIICAEVVNREAKDLNLSAEERWAHLVIHGVLHLLGHDHKKIKDAKKMEALEIEFLEAVNIANPYLFNEA